jgi:hypothetical protein
LKWWDEEDEKTTQRMKEEGRYIGGLDTNQEEYLKNSKAFKEKFNALLRQYNLQNIEE